VNFQQCLQDNAQIKSTTYNLYFNGHITKKHVKLHYSFK